MTMPKIDTPIRKCAVIGAGTMGSGIAAQMANAGAEVVLLDLEAEVAARGVTRQFKAGGFMMPEFASRVRTGSTKTDLGLLADRDWIVEAVAERLDIKRALFADLARVRKPGCILSSNTSTIPLADLVEGVTDDVAGDMLITHFFNPPRQMRLLEQVTGPRTSAETARRVGRFIDQSLGKTIVPCKDTPGFIANRIGCFWLAAGLGEALRLGIAIEAADTAMGKPFGLPRTGIFGLYDLVGIDLMPALIESLHDKLPASDAIHGYEAEPALIATMIGKGLTGRKGGGGFYRQDRLKGMREVLDLKDGTYRPQFAASDLGSDPRALIERGGIEAEYAWAVMGKTLAYAASLVPEIADRPDLVDEAMRLGYAWHFGPFELIDRLGVDWFAGRLETEGVAVPLLVQAARGGTIYGQSGAACTVIAPQGDGFAPAIVPEPEGVIALPALRRAGQPVWFEEAAALWDIGDGVGLFEFHTKLNVFTPSLIAATARMVEEAPKHFQAVVIGNDGPVFSAGADLKAMLALSEAGDRVGLKAFIESGLSAFDLVESAPFPIVGAASALAVGGGCEILLRCRKLALHAEARIGLVESRVGLLPGWGGVAHWLLRASEAGLSPEEAAGVVLRHVLVGEAASGGFAARAVHLLRATDKVVMNVDRIIAAAKALALMPDEPATAGTILLPERAALAAILAEMAPILAPHDKDIAEILANVLTGDGETPVSTAEVTRRVTEGFLDLALTEPSRERIRAMVTTGKPLRN